MMTFSLSRYPLTLGYLAGCIQQQTEWDVAIYNADFTPGGKHPEEVSYMTGPGFVNYQDNLLHMSGRVWGEKCAAHCRLSATRGCITAVSQTFSTARRIAAMAKELSPNTTVIVGAACQ